MPPSPTTGTNAGLQPHEFEFIVNPPVAPRRIFKFGKSMPERLLIAVGALLILIVIVVVIKQLLSSASTSTTSTMTAVVQAQQELVNLTGPNQLTSTVNAKLDTANSNLAATIQLVVSSNQAQLIKYLSTNGIKINSKTLATYNVTSLQQQLTLSAANGTFDKTFASLIQSQLTLYQSNLRKAYATLKGPKGKQLLSAEYNQSLLLAQQLLSGGQAS